MEYEYMSNDELITEYKRLKQLETQENIEQMTRKINLGRPY